MDAANVQNDLDEKTTQRNMSKDVRYSKLKHHLALGLNESSQQHRGTKAVLKYIKQQLHSLMRLSPGS